MKTAIYPGSFDPITNGHLDILRRALKVFDKITILVAVNPAKGSRFTASERVEMIKEATSDLPNVSVEAYDGLTLNYAKSINATHLIRGLRAVSDFEFEFQIAAANEYINNEIDCVFFMSHQELNFISSSTIDELKRNKVDISALVPQSVLAMYKRKYNI
ncbi:MAG: pantetheine-phosphate adenylyltransferase [Bacilli bacterium]